MKNWKLIAEGMGAAFDIEKTTTALDSLEAAFRRLAEDMPIDMEPAVVFDPQTEPGQ